MTRVTTPHEIARLTRALSTTAAAPRPSRLPTNLSRTAASRVRRGLEQQDAPASERTITTSHRPVVPTPNPGRVIPLMQGFHTTQQARPLQAPPHHPIDLAVLPGPDLLFAAAASSSSAGEPIIRVPLLPDNFAPARSPTVGHVPEVPDAPLAAPEIVVMAADPAAVNAVSPLSEVEGMGPDGVELMFVHDYSGAAAGRQGGRRAEGEGQVAGGMLKGLWDGIVDDVLGAGAKVKPAV